MKKKYVKLLFYSFMTFCLKASENKPFDFPKISDMELTSYSFDHYKKHSDEDAYRGIFLQYKRIGGSETHRFTNIHLREYKDGLFTMSVGSKGSLKENRLTSSNKNFLQDHAIYKELFMAFIDYSNKTSKFSNRSIWPTCKQNKC